MLLLLLFATYAFVSLFSLNIYIIFPFEREEHVTNEQKKGTQCALEDFDWRFVYFTQSRIYQSHHKCYIPERARAYATDDNEGKTKTLCGS